MPPSEDVIPKNPLNVATCPLYGGPNACALAADPNAIECWCESEEFPRELLAKVPGYAVRRACICQNCLEKYREPSNLSDDSQ